MTGKTKKHNASHTHQLAQAEFKKRFKEYIRQICISCGAGQAFDLLSEDTFRELFYLHGLPLQIHAAKGHTIAEADLHEARLILALMLPEQQYVPAEGAAKLPLSIFFSTGFCFYFYLSQEKLEGSPVTAQLRRLMHAYIESHGGYEQAHLSLNDILFVILLFISHLTTGLCSIEFCSKPRSASQFGIQYYLSITKTIPPQQHVVLDGVSRPVTRLGFGGINKETEFVSVRPGQLGLPDDGTTPPLEVYFQSHVLVRLKERLDCIIEPICQYALFSAMKDCRSSRGMHGEILVDFFIGDMKVGYLVVEPHKSMAIIRTFLFLTNDGTPEAARLCSLYGLRRLDTNYLAIDRLSAFHSDDLHASQELEAMLRVIGCEKFSEILAGMNDMLTKKETQHTGTLLMQYMGLMRGSKNISAVPDFDGPGDEVQSPLPVHSEPEEEQVLSPQEVEAETRS